MHRDNKRKLQGNSFAQGAKCVTGIYSLVTVPICYVLIFFLNTQKSCVSLYHIRGKMSKEP